MKISSAQFICSNPDYKKCPDRKLPEYAFIGRSNVGKSSLINLVTGHPGLAKTSGKPGKTQLINHFLINEKNKPWYLVDLPGYGYAKVAKSTKDKWEKLISEYILHRSNLLCVFVLIDSRLEPQKIDLEFMEWLGDKEVPFVMVFTKTDKQNETKLKEHLKIYDETLFKTWEELPTRFTSSAVSGKGKDEILSFIEHSNETITLV
jgi:GTP-binding protein